jgi:hypothetical protein
MGKQMLTNKSEVDGWPSVVSDNDLVQGVNQIYVKDGASQSQQLSRGFPQISDTVLYEIISVMLSYHKFCARWVPKMLMGAHRM